jgi:hypothetical protein
MGDIRIILLIAYAAAANGFIAPRAIAPGYITPSASLPLTGVIFVPHNTPVFDKSIHMVRTGRVNFYDYTILL